MNFSLQLIPFRFKVSKNGDEALEGRLDSIQNSLNRLIALLERGSNKKLKPIFKWNIRGSIKQAGGTGGERIRPVYKVEDEDIERLEMSLSAL